VLEEIALGAVAAIAIKLSVRIGTATPDVMVLRAWRVDTTDFDRQSCDS
jgi:hypothetical protein